MMKQKQKKPFIKFKALLVLIVPLNVVMAIANIFEFIYIKLLNQAGEYPFGAEGLPYYYDTVDIYTRVALIFGFLHMAIIIITFWLLVKKIKWGICIMFIVTILAMAAHYFNAQIS